MSESISMKPLLSKLVQRAFVLAVSDCIPPPEGINDLDAYDKRKEEIQRNVYDITPEEWAQIDPMALAQNLCCRLLGEGGWSVGGVYSANATVDQVMRATFGEGSSKNPLEDIIKELGLEEARE